MAGVGGTPGSVGGRARPGGAPIGGRGKGDGKQEGELLGKEEEASPGKRGPGGRGTPHPPQQRHLAEPGRSHDRSPYNGVVSHCIQVPVLQLKSRHLISRCGEG